MTEAGYAARIIESHPHRSHVVQILMNIRSSRLASSLALALVLVACVGQRAGENQTAAALDAIRASPHRSAENRARDVYRHPKETLLFFGIRPDMRVVEIWPGATGWYTEILAPLLRDQGQLYTAQWDTSSDLRRETVERFKQKLTEHPEIYSKVLVTTLASPPAVSEIAPRESVDMVLTFRNMHNWMAFGWERDAFAAMYSALKPGGVLGVVDHRGNPATPQDPKATSGYVNQDYAIRVIESVGFKLVATSEINANSKDSKDYEKGVWTLPPTYQQGDLNRERYRAIGESDRFTLKFVKPK
jgi:predicted methyltransferase